MNKTVSIFFVCLFLFSGKFIFSQSKEEVLIKGTVYMNSSRSQGILNGKTFSDPQRTFRNQTIYFKSDSISVKTKTDSLGVYSVQLKPATYTVYQEAGLKNIHDGMTHIGTYVIEAKKDYGPYDIFFENHVNGRSAMKGAGMQGGGSANLKVKPENGPKQK